MTNMKPLALALAASVATQASAQIDVRFIESAPKDRFTFTNASTCALGAAQLSLDLAGSAAGLIFDTSGSGAGVEVFQPFEVVSGAEILTNVSAVSDGDTTITLDVSGLAPGQSVGFTIDVDDTLTGGALGQIRVADSEIAGAVAGLTIKGLSQTAAFDATSRAQLPLDGCSS